MSRKQKYGVTMEDLFIDNGSRDHTLQILKESAEKYPHVSDLSFSRNFGKEAAMFASLEHADGDYAVIIDVDLQGPPELIEEMYTTILNSDYDCVASRRVDRNRVAGNAGNNKRSFRRNRRRAIKHKV